MSVILILIILISNVYNNVYLFFNHMNKNKSTIFYEIIYFFTFLKNSVTITIFII